MTRSISAVIACYKDGQAIPIMYERLKKVFEKINVSYEIIFVNDGSPDDSEEKLRALSEKDSHVVAINHARNFGSQSAFTSGMRASTGDAVVLLDGDLQDPPELIEEFYKKWCEGYEVVFGVRTSRVAPFLLRGMYKAFYRVFRWLSFVPIPLDAGDFSLMDRRVVNALNNLPEKNRFLRGLRAWVGFRQTGVEYVRPERMFGRTTNSLLKNFGWARKAILSFSYAPLDLIAWLAMTIVGFSFIASIVQVILRLLYPSMVPSGFTTLIILILFIGGIQLLCLSIIGSYIAHIYDEVKSRPSYVVKSINSQQRQKQNVSQNES